MGKRNALLALGTSLVLLAAACGGDDGEDGDDGTNGTNGTAGDLSGQSVEVAAVWSGEEQTRFETVLAGFTEATGAEVTFTSTGDDIGAVLGPRIEGGDPPDVAILPQPALLQQFADQGVLQDIEDVAGDEVDANYAPVWRELGTVDGTLYGVWFKAANKSTVWYNVHVFEDAGVSPPETYDDMVAVGQTIADFGIAPFSIGGASGWVLSDWFENIYVRSAGPEAYDQLTNHEIPWTDESVIEALSLFGEIVGDESLLVGGTSGTLQTDFDGSIPLVFSEDPQGAILYEGDFVGSVISGTTTLALGTDADFFNFPEIDGSAPAVVGGGDVAVLMRDSEAGAALMEYLATPEAAELWAEQGGFTSPNQGVDASVYPDDITARSAEALTGAEAFKFDMSDLQPPEFGSTEGAGIWGLLQEFVQNPDDPEGVAQQLEDAAALAFG